MQQREALTEGTRKAAEESSRRRCGSSAQTAEYETKFREARAEVYKEQGTDPAALAERIRRRRWPRLRPRQCGGCGETGSS